MVPFDAQRWNGLATLVMYVVETEADHSPRLLAGSLSTRWARSRRYCASIFWYLDLGVPLVNGWERGILGAILQRTVLYRSGGSLRD